MIRLYQFEISPFCDKVRRILHWKRQPYEVIEIPLVESFTRLRRVNSIGKLPCLEHDGRRIADSTDIAHYLEERFPEPALLPVNARDRALCHTLEDWADESLYFYELLLRFTLPHNVRRWAPVLTAHDPPWLRRIAPTLLPIVMRRLARSQGIGRKPLVMVLRDLERHVEAVGRLVEGRDWLVGDALSLADIAVFVQLYCLRGSEEGAKRIEGSEAVSAWMARVDAATGTPARC